MAPSSAGTAGWRSCAPAGAARAMWLAVLLVAIALRVAALDKPLYVDEIVTITVAVQPLAAMGVVMRQIDASPALFPLLLHFWMMLGHADWWVRLLPALLGMLAVPVVGRIACRAFGWRAGLCAAAVMAVAPAQVHYAQYVRSYSLFTLLVGLHVLLLIDWMDAERALRRGRVVVFVLLTVALLYTHYLSLLLLPAEGVFVAMRMRTILPRVLAWGGAVAIALILFLPGVPLLLHNIAFDKVRNVDRPEPPPLVRLVPDLFGEMSLGQRSLGFSDPRVRRITLGAGSFVFLIVAALGIAHGARTRPDLTVLLVAVSLVPVAIYVGSGRRLIAVRFFVPFMAGYFVLLGAGLASLGPAARRAAASALALACAVPLWHFYTAYAWSYDHRAVARAIAEASRPGDVILVVHPYEALYYRWYLGGRIPTRGMVFNALEDQERYVIKPPPVELARARSRILAAATVHPRMWVVGESTRSYASDPLEEARVLDWMDAAYNRTADLGRLTGDDPIVRLYARRDDAPGR
jgi:4-amino-4-deoxy-L-arabinose transferase-like glycosyltransferase